MTSPTPTPPCLGEREAVARTELREALARHFDGSAFQSAHQEGQYWSIRRVDAYRRADALLAGPLRTENETLRAKLAQAEGEIATMRTALQTIAEEHDAGRHDGLPEACPAHEAEVMWAVARAALTTPEHPHGD